MYERQVVHTATASLMMLGTSFLLSAQQLPLVSGYVVDEQGEPLGGATVVVRDTRHGVVTDRQGRFEIHAAEGQVLEVKYLGYERLEMPITHSTQPLRLTLQETLLTDLQEVTVTSLRAKKTTPVAHTDLNREAIQQQNTGKDVPALIAMTPSVTISSDAGNGIGYTGIHVRGTDPSRVNITANGIPLNDAESNQVYWVNLGDFASSAESMQIQRGVGTSTNGSGAFGATVNIQTEGVGDKAYGALDISAGSYNTHKETFRFGTGLLGGHWAVQGRLSNIRSKGYLDRASTSLNSYFLQAGWFDDNNIVKFITTNGKEQTYHAWNYTSKYEQSLYGRTYNSCGEYYDDNGTRRYYKGQTDNYNQQHYQLLWDRKWNTQWTSNVGLHYTKGLGYYEEYKTKRTLTEYLLTPFINAEGITVTKSDLIRQKRMDNDFYGFIASANYDNRAGLNLHLGGGWNQYEGRHFGRVIWVKNYLGELLPDHEYYHNKSKKIDGNIYAKADYSFTAQWKGYVDLQYRHTSTTMHGPSDDWTTLTDGTPAQVVYDEQYNYDFFNPKAGVFCQITPQQQAFASVAMAHKEPTRNDYEDNLGQDLKAERLVDYEIGYKYQSPVVTVGVTGYYMDYRDQFVLTGQLNEIGEAIASNSGRSYRMGIELEAAYQPVHWFRWDLNATFSRNRNKDYVLTTTDRTTYATAETMVGNTPISFSPEVIFNNVFTFTKGGFLASVMSQYIGEQYMTNSGTRYYVYYDSAAGSDQRVSTLLADYFKTDVSLSYTWKLPHLDRLTAGVTLYNLFSKKYDNNGWAWSEYGVDANGKVYAWGYDDDPYEAGFSPQAPLHVMGRLTLQF